MWPSWLAMMDTPDASQTKGTDEINIATYNIRSGRNGRLEIALRAMEQMNVDLGILTEAKLTDGIYTRCSSGYNVVATNARVHNQGGVALFYKNSPDWQVESVRHHGPNVISFQLVAASRRWGVIGAYVPPSDLDTVEYINQAFEALPRAIPPILLGDLNVDLDNPRDERGQAICHGIGSPWLGRSAVAFSSTSWLSPRHDVFSTPQWRDSSIPLRLHFGYGPAHVF